MTEDTKTILDYLNIKGEKVTTRLEFIKLLRDHQKTGITSYPREAYFFAIARSLIFEADDRFEHAGKSDPKLIDLANKMEIIRNQHHLEEDEDFWIDDSDTPEEYKKLHALWDELANNIETSTMMEFGENEMAEIYANNRDEYERLYDAGFCLFYEDDPDFDKTFKDLKQSRQEGLPDLEL